MSVPEMAQFALAVRDPVGLMVRILLGVVLGALVRAAAKIVCAAAWFLFLLVAGVPVNERRKFIIDIARRVWRLHDRSENG